MYRLIKKGTLVLMFMGFIGLSAVGGSADQPVIELILDPQPDSGALTLQSGFSELWVEARVSDRSMALEWKLEGPGDFQPIAEGFGGIYTLPDAIETASAKIRITASGTNAQGAVAGQTLELTLLAPAPTPTPEPSPTPSPTPTPVPISIRKIFLHHERFYVTVGTTVSIVIALDNPSELPTELVCKTIKGEASCPREETAYPFLEIRYTAPGAPGKDMLEIQIVETDSRNSEHALVKIDVLPE